MPSLARGAILSAGAVLSILSRGGGAIRSRSAIPRNTPTPRMAEDGTTLKVAEDGTLPPQVQHPPLTVNKRTACVLLECFLVFSCVRLLFFVVKLQHLNHLSLTIRLSQIWMIRSLGHGEDQMGKISYFAFTCLYFTEACLKGQIHLKVTQCQRSVKLKTNSF